MVLDADRIGAWLAVAGLTVSLGFGVVKWIVLPNLSDWLDKRLDPIEKALSETHKQVTENHHSNPNPTVLDLLLDLLDGQSSMRGEFEALSKALDSHLGWSNEEVDRLWRAIGKKQSKPEPPTSGAS